MVKTEKIYLTRSYSKYGLFNKILLLFKYCSVWKTAKNVQYVNNCGVFSTQIAISLFYSSVSAWESVGKFCQKYSPCFCRVFCTVLLTFRTGRTGSVIIARHTLSSFTPPPLYTFQFPAFLPSLSPSLPPLPPHFPLPSPLNSPSPCTSLPLPSPSFPPLLVLPLLPPPSPCSSLPPSLVSRIPPIPLSSSPP